MFKAIKKISHTFSKKKFNYFLLLFCLLLPFQFALNPTKGIDLAIVRIVIPIFFITWLIIKSRNNERFFNKSNTEKLLFAFIFLAILSFYFSPNFLWSTRKLFFLFSIAPTYFIFVSIFKNEINHYKVFLSLTIGASLLAIVAILQFVSQFVFSIDAVCLFLSDKISPFFLGQSFSKMVMAYPSWLVNSEGTTYMRAVAIFPDPHMLSYYLELIIPFSFALSAVIKKNRAWLLLCSIVLIIADILTFSRGSYIAIIAGSLIILPMVSKATIKKILLGTAFLVLFFVLAPHAPVAERFKSSFDTKEGSNQARISNWNQAFSVIASHPFGVGIGTYSLAIKSDAQYREPIYAHNLYLDIAAEIGIVAMVIFIFLLFIAFRNFWKSGSKNHFFIAGTSSVAIFAVHSLVENPLYSVHVLPLFLIILALSESTKINEGESDK